MVEIKEISYKDERLGFFADQRKLVQKRYDRLKKQIKPDEPYTSERREFLSDLGRELSFYNDVIAMLENGVVPKSDVKNIFTEIENLFDIHLAHHGSGMHSYRCLLEDILELKKKYE